MPPCAAIECAGGGESWKVMTFTRYPSSPSVAAADAPARPVPTTMISNRRLFAGFTSLMSNRWLSHFCSIGPSGIFESSFMIGSARLRAQLGIDGGVTHRGGRDRVRTLRLHGVQLDPDQEADVADQHDDSEALGESPPHRVL